MIRMTRLRLLAVLAAVATAAGACSFSIGGNAREDASDAAVQVVRELDEDGALGIEEIDCDVPAEDAEGTTFACVSDTAAGDRIRWGARITSGGVEVESLNLITEEGLQLLVDAIADVVSNETGNSYTATDLDCGTPPLVLDETQEIDCDLAENGGNTALIVTISDTRTGDFQVRAAP